ncbi:MAG TPA: hypothetical protein PKK67_02090 [Cyclobacteriaceae bacterium]|jgi:hypothetical protein|nr:hypothetical protein [Cyclobacteriaceae bacterium]
MAKKKEMEIVSVELKNPEVPLTIKKLGINITSENLTIERYQMVVNISKDFEKFFIVKQTPKKDEVQTEK